MNNENLIIIRNDCEELDNLIEYIKASEFIAYDTETTGVNKDAKIIGFSVSADEETGYYVILAEWSVEQQKILWLDTVPRAKEVISLLISKKLIMQNAPFDCEKTFDNFGIELMPYVHTDTMILGHLLDENRRNGLKELGVALFGEDARKEQEEMKASVHKNGGVLTKELYELYKADSELLARYGAKDAILTMKVFNVLVPQLFEEKLDKFFYEDESMPLLRGPTYEMNTTGLRVDHEKLQLLKQTLEAESLQAKAYIYQEITPHVKDKYKGTGKTNTFNIGAPQQLAWLLFDRLGNNFFNLTKNGRELCKALDLRMPYTNAAKREFIHTVSENKGRVWAEAAYNKKTQKMGRPKKVGDYWTYTACGKETLTALAKRYKWVEAFIKYKKDQKLLKTYVAGIQTKSRYNIISPSFLQHGTTSGRYSSRNPNFQNLPRDDKRIKACIISRPGKVFVGADYAQLEPRVFASVSQDPTLMGCFEKGLDFYSVVGAPIFNKTDCPLKKDEEGSFAKKHPDLRDKSKVIALATPYGRTAMQQSQVMGISIDESQALIDKYFEEYPSVYKMMIDSHEEAKRDGVVYSLYGRPRRIPEAKKIKEIYGNAKHKDLPYAIRTLLNLAMNHKPQSSGASIMNRAAIAFWVAKELLAFSNPLWKEVKIVMQVHDELISEGPEELKYEIAKLKKSCMEDTTKLPGVALLAEPKIAYNLADLK